SSALIRPSPCKTNVVPEVMFRGAVRTAGVGWHPAAASAGLRHNRQMNDESSPDGQDARSRRSAIVGLLIVLALIGGGSFRVHWLREMSRGQDCVMSGRTNRAPIRPSTG